MMHMARAPIFEWQGRGYASEEKSADWYWALGIIAIAGIIAAVLFSDILFAVVIAVAAVTIALYTAKRPRIHRFAIYDRGIQIDDSLYSYDNMIDFSVLEYLDESLPPALSVKTRSLFAPHLLIPIIGYDPELVYDYVAGHLPEGKHDESFFDRMADMLRL
jgi:hypothetical protein